MFARQSSNSGQKHVRGSRELFSSETLAELDRRCRPMSATRHSTCGCLWTGFIGPYLSSRLLTFGTLFFLTAKLSTLSGIKSNLDIRDLRCPKDVLHVGAVDCVMAQRGFVPWDLSCICLVQTISKLCVSCSFRPISWLSKAIHRLIGQGMLKQKYSVSHES